MNSLGAVSLKSKCISGSSDASDVNVSMTFSFRRQIISYTIKIVFLVNSLLRFFFFLMFLLFDNVFLKLVNEVDNDRRR